MASKNTKTARSEIFIGGTGLLPVMHFSHGVPVPRGAEYVVNVTIETPTHRYTLHRMLMYDDYKLFPGWTKTSRFAQFSVMTLCGAPYDYESGLCLWDADTPPSVEHMCAIKWGDGEWQANAVTIVELSIDDRMAHLKTLAGEKSSSVQINAIVTATNIEALEKCRSEIADLTRMTKLMATPSGKLKYWEALLQSYLRADPKLSEEKKWLCVARMVIMGVQATMNDPKISKTDYTTPTIYKHLVSDLRAGTKALGPSIEEPAAYELSLAHKLRIYATREAKKAKINVRDIAPT